MGKKWSNHELILCIRLINSVVLLDQYQGKKLGRYFLTEIKSKEPTRRSQGEVKLIIIDDIFYRNNLRHFFLKTKKTSKKNRKNCIIKKTLTKKQLESVFILNRDLTFLILFSNTGSPRYSRHSQPIDNPTVHIRDLNKLNLLLLTLTLVISHLLPCLSVNS